MAIPQEQWESRRLIAGDHIRVIRHGLYSHHGIYVSDSEVIHFSGRDSDSIFDWSKCEVISTDLTTFQKGGTVEARNYSDSEKELLYSPEDIVEYARFRLGDKGYHLIFNNCEHFVNSCVSGKLKSTQVQRVLNGEFPISDQTQSSTRDFHRFLENVEKTLLSPVELDETLRLINLKDESYLMNPFYNYLTGYNNVSLSNRITIDTLEAIIRKTIQEVKNTILSG